MKFLKNAGGWAFGLITFAACTTCTTLGHYAETWAIGYFVGLAFAAFGGIAVALTMIGD